MYFLFVDYTKPYKLLTPMNVLASEPKQHKRGTNNMKLWQYGVISVLIIGAFTFGTGWGYNDGYDAAYVYGYADGIFDEGWNAAAQHNGEHTDLWGETFYLDGGVWFVSIPTHDGDPMVQSYNGEYWQMVVNYET